MEVDKFKIDCIIIIGKYNNVKTHITNLNEDIVNLLNFSKYLQIKLGAQTTIENNIIIISGRHDRINLQNLLDEYLYENN